MENVVLPLVSCIMPTSNRRSFVPDAIRYFLQQDYNNKELLIVDDGDDSVEDLIPPHEQIRYKRIQKKMTLGEKRNYCIRESNGDLIMHWDDDDWMAPYRIRYQVNELLKKNAEVCGLQQMLFRELTTGKCWLYKYPPHAQPWLAGGSLLYTRSFWAKSPFPDMQVASDTRFIFARKLTSFVALADHNFYVASVHHHNTSSKNTASNLWHPVDESTVKKIMGEEWGVHIANNKRAQKATSKLNGNKGKNGTQNNTSVKKITRDKVSVCLLSYKRPGNIQKIIDSIYAYPFFDEIIVWNNNPSYQLTLKGSKVRVINSTENTMCYGRFLCAAEAKNNVVYFQDDDAIINNIQELYEAFLQDSSRIAYGLSSRHFAVKEIYDYPSTQISFLGWGAFIQKAWINVLDDYLKENPTDFIFLREADKFFTLLLGKHNNAILGDIELLADDSTHGIALYLEKEHCLYVALAVRRALEYNRMQLQFIPVTWNIVISCRNYGRFLEEAVNSVLYNHADYIITIVDDASTDNTAEVCRRLTNSYPFIKYIRNEQQMGAGHSRNKGIGLTDSVFVIMLDADDKLGPEYLFEAEKMLRKDADVVNPDAILFGNIASRWPVPETVSLDMQLDKNHVHCCSAFRRSYWAQVGGLDEKMLCWEDYEFWIRVSENGARIKKIAGNHFYYRKHGESRSSDLHEQRVSQTYIYKKHGHLFQNQPVE
ncbi:glycosyltransferase [Mucilaginibacter agri]|uniref:Glycosyltransferase n=1 Tax=Mucilaginibacter agri TaxID=2695265 RepID=A0A965ZII7_9SPHI|nr:glycosyltransferase [Mucilaginibacter agri]NCD71700.1 glycosyltransferase [Mucilaginibacter agri]